MIQFWVASWKQNGKFVDIWVVAHGDSFFGGLNHQGHLVQSQVLSRSTGWNPFAAAPCRSQYSKHPRRNSAKFGNQVEPHMQGHGPIVILPWNSQLLTPLESNYVITIDDYYKWITICIYIYIYYHWGARLQAQSFEVSCLEASVLEQLGRHHKPCLQRDRTPKMTTANPGSTRIKDVSSENHLFMIVYRQNFTKTDWVFVEKPPFESIWNHLYTNHVVFDSLMLCFIRLGVT